MDTLSFCCTFSYLLGSGRVVIGASGLDYDTISNNSIRHKNICQDLYCSRSVDGYIITFHFELGRVLQVIVLQVIVLQVIIVRHVREITPVFWDLITGQSV